MCFVDSFRLNPIIFDGRGVPFGSYRLQDRIQSLFVPNLEAFKQFFGTLSLKIKPNEQLNSLEKDLQLSSHFEEKKGELVSTFLRASKSEAPRFVKIFERLTDDQLAEFINESFNQAAESHPSPLIEKLMKLFTLKKIETILRIQFPSLEGVENEVLSIANGAKKDYQLKELQSKRTIAQVALIYILNVINYVVDTLLYVFHLKEADAGDEGIFGADYRAERRYAGFQQNMILLSGWFVALSVFLESRLKAALLFSVGGLLSSLAIYGYLEWLKPCPDKILSYQNLVSEVSKGNVPVVYGRDNEIDLLIDRLRANRGSVRKHPLLIGETGVGKTEIINGLAWRIARGKVPPELRHLKIFVVSAPDLVGDGPFARQSKLEAIKAALKGHESDAILFFDEFHAPFMRAEVNGVPPALGQRFKTLLNPGLGSFKYCVGATTNDEYEKHIAGDKALCRRLKKIEVKPIDSDQTYAVLSAMIQKEAADLIVDEEAVKKLAHITEERKKSFEGAPQPYTSMNILSEVIAKAREPKQNEKRRQLNALLDRKLTLECSQSLAKGADLFTFTKAGSVRAKELKELRDQIEALEKEIGDERLKLDAFSLLILKLGALKKAVTAASLEIEGRLQTKRKVEDQMKNFILNHVYLRLSLEKRIEERRQEFPDTFIVDQKGIDQVIESETEVEVS